LCTERSCSSEPRITAFTTNNMEGTTFEEPGDGTSISMFQDGKLRYKSELLSPPLDSPNVRLISYHTHQVPTSEPATALATFMQVTNPFGTQESVFGATNVTFDPDWMEATFGWTLDPKKIQGCFKVSSPNTVSGAHIANLAPYPLYGKLNGTDYAYPSDKTTIPIEYTDYGALMEKLSEYTPLEFDVMLNYRADGRVYPKNRNVCVPSENPDDNPVGEKSMWLEKFMLEALGVEMECKQCPWPQREDAYSRRRLLFGSYPSDDLPCCLPGTALK